eukprot:CAMPEP_0172659492 /NCGR_PEP_ID=MMETSP1074-20121228/3465_1 /TAXON_ID=2916 /ORGANISM="Ceratium fusus, Strain PA161109" /LENGTH=101 /DNA_ID=CAMNT_0013474973 /DNA_START=403 /DNA_END=706 /DNA_ORIENTATION=+
MAPAAPCVRSRGDAAAAAAEYLVLVSDNNAFTPAATVEELLSATSRRDGHELLAQPCSATAGSRVDRQVEASPSASRMKLAPQMLASSSTGISAQAISILL